MHSQGDQDAKDRFDQCIKAAILTGVAEGARQLTSEGTAAATDEVCEKLRSSGAAAGLTSDSR